MLLGAESVEKLKTRRVAVFGIGGVGGHCAEALCRSGVGEIDLIDGDVVSITDLNRQIIATHKTLGRLKAEVMRERMLEINPDISVRAFPLYYTADTAGGFDLGSYSYIADAIDMVTAKVELITRSSACGTPLISAMGAGNKLDPAAFEVGDIYGTSVCPLARTMRSLLKKRGVESLKVVYSKEKPIVPAPEHGGGLCPREAGGRAIPASNAFVPPVAGLIMAGEIAKDLL